MGKVLFKNWVDIVSTARSAPEFKLEHYTVSSPTKRRRGITGMVNLGRRKALRITKPPPRITQKRPSLTQVRRIKLS